MRTRFVIHKNLLSPVFKVLKRPVIKDQWGAPVQWQWNPEDIVVQNPKRPEGQGWFILPKSEYIPCDSKGNINTHVKPTEVPDSYPQQASGGATSREDYRVA